MAMMAVANFGILLLITLAYTGSTVLGCDPGWTGRYCTEYDITENKTAEQSDHFTQENAALAIDGNATTCSYTSVQAQPWWEVNFNQRFSVKGLIVTVPWGYPLGNMAHMTVEVYDGGQKRMCHASDAAPFAPQITIDCVTQVTGDRLRITIHADADNTTVQLTLCNVGVYGECVDGRYGHYCEHLCGNCKNRTTCDKYTGHCVECDVGFKFPLCQEDCDFGFYGKHCVGVCGNCLNNATCEVDDGKCRHGCEPGYYEPNCTIACKPGTFGDNCIDCGHCRDKSVTCNFTTGFCPPRALCNEIECPNVNCTYKRENSTLAHKFCPTSHLCETGWDGDDCRSECPDKFYGDSCLYSCENCFNSSCNPVNGRCGEGCLPGYKWSDIMCKTLCDPGFFGEDCAETCGSCRNSSFCQPTDGSCRDGCEVGYQGSICKDPCDDGLYGLNCDEHCGHCSDIKCEAVSGNCSGTCIPGWLGTGCSQACPKGRYGQDCLKFCPQNCISLECNNENGYCTCKKGWTGTLCNDECHYGPDCPSPCGHCNAGSACNKTTGTCINGCSEGWKGFLCLKEVIIEKPVDKQFVAGMIVLGVIIFLMAVALVIWIVYRKKTGQKLEPNWMGIARSSIRRSFRRSMDRLSFRNRYHEHNEKGEPHPDGEEGFGGQEPRSKRHGRGYRRLYEVVGVPSNTIPKDDFPRIYLQLQELDVEGKAKFETAYQSFLRQRPTYNPINPNSKSSNGVNSYYNNAVHTDEIEIDLPSSQPRVPAFSPLGSNLSGFFLIHAGAQSESVWNHLQQRQVETVVSIEKDASVQFKAGERYEIGSFTIECLEVHRNPCYIESKITIRKRGTQGRRAIRHIETTLWENDKDFAAIPTFLLFIQRVQQLYQTKRERPVLINYKNIHDQAVLYCVCASLIELTRETGRIDVLRAVNSGGTLVGKVFNSFEHFKYLHDVMFHTIAMDSRNQKF